MEPGRGQVVGEGFEREAVVPGRKPQLRGGEPFRWIDASDLG